MEVRCVILGGGGHARVVIEALRLAGIAQPEAIVDRDALLHGSVLDGVPNLGGDDQLPALKERGMTHFAMGLGGVTADGLRGRLFDHAEKLGLLPLTVIHPNACVSPSAVLGVGCQILAGAIISAGATLGRDVVVNTGAIVEHDCVIEDHVHIATGARLCGAVHVGESAHIGAGCTVRQLIRIGPRATVGIGAAVVLSVLAEQIVAGVPARAFTAR